jgi:hypothetical protein
VVLTNEPFYLTNVGFMWRKSAIPETKYDLSSLIRALDLAGFLISVRLIANFILWFTDGVDGKGCLDI